MSEALPPPDEVPPEQAARETPMTVLTTAAATARRRRPGRECALHELPFTSLWNASAWMGCGFTA